MNDSSRVCIFMDIVYIEKGYFIIIFLFGNLQNTKRNKKISDLLFSQKYVTQTL